METYDKEVHDKTLRHEGYEDGYNKGSADGYSKGSTDGYLEGITAGISNLISTLQELHLSGRRLWQKYRKNMIFLLKMRKII